MSLLSDFPEFVQNIGLAWKAFRELRDESRRATAADPDAVVLKDDIPGQRSRLDIHTQTEDMLGTQYFALMNVVRDLGQDIPRRGTVSYIKWLDDIWKKEPILAGAVYSMEAKMQAMTWKVEGGRNNAKQFAEMLSRARYMTGNGWSGFIGSSAIDFYTQDGGVYWDAIRWGNGKYTKIIDLATIDTRNCILTGNAKEPMYYCSSMLSQDRWYKPWEYIHFSSMQLPDELELGLGFCAVSRAARAAKLLMALHDYDAQKISNLPPEGIASVTGLTDREFRQAITLWKNERKKNNSLTFPQVLWLIGSNPGAKVSVDIAAFSSLPESFDRKTVVSQYVNTLALCFGVDTREFWAISTGALGTASEAEVQHMKARGKGGGEFIALVERSLNMEMPEDTVFEFDTQDIEEDMVNASVAKEWIDAYLPLVYPPKEGGEALGKPVLDIGTFKRLMADAGILPEWAVGDERITIESGEVHKDYMEDLLRFTWVAGRLQSRQVIRLNKSLDDNDRIPVTFEKDTMPSLISGKPIGESEVNRGAKVTRKAISAELEFWGTVDELKTHVPEEMLNG